MTPIPGWLAIWLLALVAAIAAVALLALLARRRLRLEVDDLAGRLAELRRHPLVGSIGERPVPELRAAAQEMEGLVEALRDQVVRAQGRASALQAFADGPADVALVGIDGEWIVTTFSRGANALTGWAPEEILGQHVEALFGAGEWERILPKLARRTLRQEGFAEVYRLLHRDGRLVPCRVSVGPARPEAGGSGGTLLVARDMSQEIEMERRLRVSEERHRRLVDEIQDGVCVLQGGRIAFANASFSRLLGVEDAALRNLAFKDLLDARDLLMVLDRIARTESGGDGPGEVLCRMAAPGRAPIEARLTWSGTEYQGQRAVFCTIADMTERARFERTIALSEARLRATLEAAGEGLLVVADSPRGPRALLANAAWSRVFGQDASAWADASAEDVKRLLSAAGLDAAAVSDLLDGARGREVRRDGAALAAPRSAIVDLFAGPVRSRAGETVGVVVTARDVTSRVESEQTLKKSLEERRAALENLEASLRELSEARQALQERNVQLERFNTELRSLDEMKSNLLANVSHELHTPLVSIKGYTEMVLKRKLGPLTPEQERGLEVALKNIDRLIELIDNLLSFARMETGETQLTLEDIPIWKLVDEAIDLVGERVKRRNLSVTTQYDSDDLLVRGDRVKLGQVFTNLLTNAVKFNRDGGTITVAARRGRSGYVEIEVADSGIGIPPAEQEKIFERFYQVEAGPRRRYEGTGIGLSIVRDILRLHGCAIRVASTPGEGSTFTFTLPLGRRAEASDAKPPLGRNRTRE